MSRSSSTAHDFCYVDVFTAEPFQGNPVAVVFSAETLAPDLMQRIAAWTNLSETTFVLPPVSPEADYRLRIFAPRNEMRFAGHPTIGTAHVLLERGLIRPRDGRVVQECLAGLVPVRIEDIASGRRLWVTVPRPKCFPVDTAQLPESTLGLGLAPVLPLAIIDVGPRWLIADLGRASDVDRLQPDFAIISGVSAALDVVGITVFGRLPHGSAQFRVRSFAPREGVPEDAVCGTGNASVAAFLRHAGAASDLGRGFVTSQGRALGRNGEVHIRFVGDKDVEIGGAAITCIEGVGTIPASATVEALPTAS